MKLFFFILLTLFTSSLAAQNYRITYDFEYKRDSLAEHKTNMNMILDIQNGYSKFYYQKLLKIDSLYKKNTMVYYSMPMLQIVKRKTGSIENQNFVNVDDLYYTFPTVDQLNWKILDSVKYFKNYKLQKAVAKWGKRNWIAWFSSDIPISEGRYKFSGLPGLIFEVRDDKNNFQYKLISIIKANEIFDTNNFVENNFGNQPLTISENKYRKLLLNAYYNPFSEYKTMKDGAWN